MKKHLHPIIITSLLIALSNQSFSQNLLSVQAVIEKNLQSVGSQKNIAQVKNYSFRVNQKTYYISQTGSMKITSGQAPIITEVILTSADKVERNCYNRVTAFEGLIKATYHSLALLRSGLFTLKNFQDKLEYKGLKKFGPKSLHMLTAKMDDLQVHFYLDSELFNLKRLVLAGYSPERGKYEVNHDFGPLQEIEGIKIPTSWFSSQVGARGTTHEITEVKINSALADDFFSNLNINVGQITIGDKNLEGNIITFNARRQNMIFISTNWTTDSMQKAGFVSEETLVLEIAGKEIPIKYYALPPFRNIPPPGVKVLMPNRRDENFLIYLMTPEYRDIVPKLAPLLPIRIIKK